MSKILTTAAAIIVLGSAPALATNYHDYHPWATTHASTNVHLAGPVSLYGYYARHGYAGPVSSSAEGPWSAQHRDGYDGRRYWWGGDCWPTEPGGCD
jgi:hypothetical protein